MWRMLTKRADDLRIELLEREADGPARSAHWRAHYTYSQTGRPVVERHPGLVPLCRTAGSPSTSTSSTCTGGCARRSGPMGTLLGWAPRCAARCAARARGPRWTSSGQERLVLLVIGRVQCRPAQRDALDRAVRADAGCLPPRGRVPAVRVLRGRRGSAHVRGRRGVGRPRGARPPLRAAAPGGVRARAAARWSRRRPRSRSTRSLRRSPFPVRAGPSSG